MDATPERTQAGGAAAGQPAPTLRVRGLSYAYGKAKALDDVALAVRPGRVTALLGPNGAGKTTLFSLVTGLFDSRQGEIEIAGHPLRRARSRALAALGIVFQAQTLDLDLTVEQNLRYFAALASPFALAALVFAVVGLANTTGEAPPGERTAALSVVLFPLATSLLACAYFLSPGLLAELAVKASDLHAPKTFAPLTSRGDES